MSELFDTTNFSSKNDGTRDFEIENLSSKKKVVRSQPVTDPAWDDLTPEVSSKKIFLEEKDLPFGFGTLPSTEPPRRQVPHLMALYHCQRILICLKSLKLLGKNGLLRRQELQRKN